MHGHTVVIGYGDEGESRDHGATRERGARRADPRPRVRPPSGGGGDHGRLRIGLRDATRTAVLENAGTGHAARMIVVRRSRDDTSVLATLSVRQLNTEATLVASVRSAENAPLLRSSGADTVIVSAEAAGRMLGVSGGVPGHRRGRDRSCSPPARVWTSSSGWVSAAETGRRLTSNTLKPSKHFFFFLKKKKKTPKTYCYGSAPARRVGRDLHGQSARILDRLAVDRDDDVAGLDAGLRRRAVARRSRRALPGVREAEAVAMSFVTGWICTPRKPRVDLAVVAQVAPRPAPRVCAGMAKPMPTLPPDGETIAVLTPTTSPASVEGRAAGVAAVDRRVDLDEVVVGTGADVARRAPRRCRR